MTGKNIYEESLLYHRKKPFGKLSVVPTKPLIEKHDLALAYSPGVAEPCLQIAKDPLQAAELTIRSNLIAVISNGTAVLGLGNIGPLAAKPVMEGKAALFKKFSGIDAFDIEINETDPDKLIDIIASLEPTFGGINLEDIRAPECFYIEAKLKERLKIPVFHDDQHGTAIIVGAAVLNALSLVNKTIENAKIVTSGAGAAALACLDLLVDLGAKKENIIVFDSKGMLHKDRSDPMDEWRKRYLRDLPCESLDVSLEGADIFLGLSVANILKENMIIKMAKDPIILALSNPEPEICPLLAKKIRPDAIVATGRSDFPNQVNNAICFPYIFRGALDVGATVINDAMKIAAVKAISDLARAESSDVVSSAYGDEVYTFGPEFIIPKPFDPRLYVEIAYVVAKAAVETGVATRPISNFRAYKETLMEFIHHSSLVMKPIFTIAKNIQDKACRLTFSEGEEERVLQAIQVLVDEGLARPILIGRPDIIERRVHHLRLRVKNGKDFDIVDPNNDSRYHTYWTTYHQLMERKGISPAVAKTLVRTNTTVIAALMAYLEDTEAVICGTVGRYLDHFRHIKSILGNPSALCATLCALIRDDGPLFFCDPYINAEPSADDLIQMVTLSAKQIRQFGITPKVAFVSHSNFGTSHLESSSKMREAIKRIHSNVPDLEVEGEMHADLALCNRLREKVFPNSKLQGRANLLVFPNIESANISYNLIKAIGNTDPIGPILMGISKGVIHVLNTSATVRSIVNMAALAIVEVHEKKSKK